MVALHFTTFNEGHRCSVLIRLVSYIGEDIGGIGQVEQTQSCLPVPPPPPPPALLQPSSCKTVFVLDRRHIIVKYVTNTTYMPQSTWPRCASPLLLLSLPPPPSPPVLRPLWLQLLNQCQQKQLNSIYLRGAQRREDLLPNQVPALA